MLRPTLALASILAAAGAARADQVAAPKPVAWFKLTGGIAVGDAAQIAGALAVPLRYEGLAFTDDACARAFGVSGTVKAAKLKRFATCLTHLLGAAAAGAARDVTIAVDLSRDADPRVNHLVVHYAVADDQVDHETDDGVEGGEIGGVLGGSPDLGPGAPPPPPPPPAPPVVVPPAVVTPLIIKGSTQVAPSASVAAEIKSSGKASVSVPVKLCFSASGVATSARLLKSSGFPAYDSDITTAFKAIRIKPFEVNGHATAVCTAITVVYAIR
ncbi:MAG: hypothetical protein K8W52_43505 [Deltaproteobacteria bacterium]|nr:hypothetical protein [Deltaproteobacteria bacterium]